MTTIAAQPSATREPHEGPARAEAPPRKYDRYGRMSVVSKLMVCFASVTLLTAVVGGTGYFSIAKINHEIGAEGRLALASARTSQLTVDIAQAQLHAERYQVTGRTEELTRARARLKEAKQAVADAGAIAALNTGERAGQLAVLEGALQSYDAALNNLEADRESPARTLSRTGDELLAGAQAINGSVDQELVAMRADLGSFMYWTRLAIAALFLVWVVNALAVAHRLARDISGRIKRLTTAMLRLVDGEKDLVIPDTDRVDEFGDMARSLETFRRGYLKLDRLRAEQVEQQREKEEMRSAQAALLLQLADKFERTVGDVVGGVAAASTQLQLTASSMASAAEQSSLQATEVSVALSEASGGVTAAAAASDEFAMSIGEISRQAATSAELARKATVAAADADATISALSSSAQQVGQIVELISSIAQRTNLLALNASIEAARGGEAGRGFAVVASEVKELAAQTSKATDAVAQQIRAIQSSTDASVSALRAIGSQVEQLEATSVSIAAAVDQQSVAGQDLARSIDLAARSTDDVTSSIVHVRETSLATGAAASQVLTSSTELEGQAVVLKAQVHEFLSHVRAA